ncbi:MAG: phospholipase D-like domain-containing protein, partial [Candidatus Rokuibacteriota bacterium]
MTPRRTPRRRSIAALSVLVLAVGCARLPSHLVVPSLGIDEPAWRATAEVSASSPIVPGNAVAILRDGIEIFPAILTAIRSARRTITYEQFVYKDGSISRVLAEAFAERCRAGVAVHILIDGFGVRWLPAEHRELLEAAGCQFAVFRPLTLGYLLKMNYRTHRRILVVDGAVGFTGGSGVGAQWLGAEGPHRWREIDVRVEGPVVRWLQGAFAEHWLEATGTLLAGEDYYPSLAPAGTVDAQVVHSSPSRGNTAIYTLYLLAIGGARQSIRITNQYLVLDDRMAVALIAAVRRGVEVDIIVPAIPTNILVFAAGRARLDRLLRGGVRVHAYEARLLHAKTMA